MDVFVRERGFVRHNTGSQVLSKVVGVTDLALWQAKRAVFDEISPATVKKLLTGTGVASKEQVAEALERYVGQFQYANDDQSDSVAVGIAWLIQSNAVSAGEICRTEPVNKKSSPK